MQRVENNIKLRVQGIILCCSCILMAGKFAAYYHTGSVAIFTDAMESIVNVAAGGISLYCISLATRPRDAGHPFGHGKIEMISASMEGILIITAGGIIIYHGVERLFLPSHLTHLDVGIYISTATAVINYLLGWYGIAVGRKHLSEALIAEGRHLHSDTYSTIGLVAGLILVNVTGITLIDSLTALLFGTLIIFTGIRILRKTIARLTDEADPEKLALITDIVNRHRQPDWIDIHNLRILEYGSYCLIECDLTLPWYYSVAQGHRACETLQESIRDSDRQEITLSVHADSCNKRHCRHCEMTDCHYRRHAFEQAEPLSLHLLTQSDEEYLLNDKL